MTQLTEKINKWTKDCIKFALKSQREGKMDL